MNSKIARNEGRLESLSSEVKSVKKDLRADIKEVKEDIKALDQKIDKLLNK